MRFDLLELGSVLTGLFPVFLFNFSILSNMHFKFLFLLLFISTLFSCSNHTHDEHKQTLFAVTHPVKTDTTIFHEYVCQIHSSQHVEIRAMERGFIQQIYVDEGQFIKKGQAMFKLLPLIQQAEVNKAKAEVGFAEVEYLNTKSLCDSHIVSVNELALAKAKLEKSKAELALAQTHLDFTEIKAPFDGVMNLLQVRLGSLVEEGMLLTTLSDNSKMWVYFNVPEPEYLAYSKTSKTNGHQKVKLRLANQEIFDQDGNVETIEADFNNETGTIAFRASFYNPKGILRHGETGNILMPVRLQNAILIPQKATFEILDKRYVYVVNEKGKVVERKIEVLSEMPHVYAIKSGLTEKDLVITEGIRKVHSGEQIQTRLLDCKSVIKESEHLYAE